MFWYLVHIDNIYNSNNTSLGQNNNLVVVGLVVKSQVGFCLRYCCGQMQMWGLVVVGVEQRIHQQSAQRIAQLGGVDISFVVAQ